MVGCHGSRAYAHPRLGGEDGFPRALYGARSGIVRWTRAGGGSSCCGLVQRRRPADQAVFNPGITALALVTPCMGSTMRLVTGVVQIASGKFETTQGRARPDVGSMMLGRRAVSRSCLGRRWLFRPFPQPAGAAGARLRSTPGMPSRAGALGCLLLAVSSQRGGSVIAADDRFAVRDIESILCVLDDVDGWRGRRLELKSIKTGFRARRW
jgi:hypothetical protein